TYGDLVAMPQQTQESVLQCVGGARGRARWEGVALRHILERAAIQTDAKKVVFHAADGYHSSIPIKVALKSDSLLALKMNDEPLWPRHGWPVRFVLPGKYGYKQVKWITRSKRSPVIIQDTGNNAGIRTTALSTDRPDDKNKKDI
ncbi:MAG: molybdopterin-dependent oxidoreductase, partial [candidate division Zixibacteria bacterium]|nr:molybdopterin-dependent oxidoreductase [candidate division Zixibacteria bacterium]